MGMMKRTTFGVFFVLGTLLGHYCLAETIPENILKAIVSIRATIPKEASTAATLGTERQGHGVLIGDQGLIVTIGYLIVESEKIEVLGPEGKTIEASFVGYDHETGFGLLRASQPISAEPMKLGEPSKVKEGDSVTVAIYGGSDAVVEARVLSRKEFAGYWEYLLERPIITAPAIANFGGAALLSKEGKLLGIGSLFTSFSIQGLGALPANLFVPIDLLGPIMADLIGKGRPRKPPRPWLGIHVEESRGRVFITRVTKGGPAEKAGVWVDDLILMVNGKEVTGIADLYKKIWACGNAGVEITLDVLRGTKIQKVTIRSGDRLDFLMLRPKKMI